jgi:hypothetical protein
MQQQSSVLLIDDGELDDVRSLLREIGAETSELRGGAIPERVPPPRDLLVTTSRRARVAEGWPAPMGDPPHPVKIAVVTEDSITARRMLRLMGFDFLVRRPVHPSGAATLEARSAARWPTGTVCAGARPFSPSSPCRGYGSSRPAPSRSVRP